MGIYFLYVHTYVNELMYNLLSCPKYDNRSVVGENKLLL